MKEMIEKMAIMVEDLEKQKAKIIAGNVDNEQILLVAKFCGIVFEYGYNAKTKKLRVTCNGEIIEEMKYTFFLEEKRKEIVEKQKNTKRKERNKEIQQ